MADAPSVSGNLVMNGTGTLILGATNTFTGSVTINSGTIQLGQGAGSGNLGSASSIINNGTFILNRSGVITQGQNFPSISGTGTVIKNGSGTVNMNSSTYTGETLINEGILRLQTDTGFGTGNIRFNGGTMSYPASGATTLDVSARINNSTSPIRIETQGFNVTFTSLSSNNTAGLVKTGTGALILSGSSNNYGGATTVSAGTLTFSGTYTANNSVAINGASNPILNITGNFTQTFTGSGVRSFQLAVSSGNTGTVNVSG